MSHSRHSIPNRALRSALTPLPAPLTLARWSDARPTATRGYRIEEWTQRWSEISEMVGIRREARSDRSDAEGDCLSVCVSQSKTVCLSVSPETEDPAVFPFFCCQLALAAATHLIHQSLGYVGWSRHRLAELPGPSVVCFRRPGLYMQWPRRLLPHWDLLLQSWMGRQRLQHPKVSRAVLRPWPLPHEQQGSRVRLWCVLNTLLNILSPCWPIGRRN